MTTPDIQERRERALDLAIGGASLRAIGRTLGVSHETARTDIDGALRELARINVANRNQLRALMFSRYERLLQAIMPRALGANAEGTPGRADLESVDRAVRILDSMGKLMGLQRDSTPTLADLVDDED